MPEMQQLVKHFHSATTTSSNVAYYWWAGQVYNLWCDISSGLCIPRATVIGSFLTELLKN